MLRVLLTVLLHGVVFIALWWQQTKDSVAEPNNLSYRLCLLAEQYGSLGLGNIGFYVVVSSIGIAQSPAPKCAWAQLVNRQLAVCPCDRHHRFHEHHQPSVAVVAHFQYGDVWHCHFHGLSARVARVPKQNGKK
jgi:hypothetical protein